MKLTKEKYSKLMELAFKKMKRDCDQRLEKIVRRGSRKFDAENK